MEKVIFITFNYCVRPFFNLDVQYQESFNLQVSKPFIFQPCPISKAVYADVVPSHPPSQHSPCASLVVSPLLSFFSLRLAAEPWRPCHLPPLHLSVYPCGVRPPRPPVFPPARHAARASPLEIWSNTPRMAAALRGRVLPWLARFAAP